MWTQNKQQVKSILPLVMLLALFGLILSNLSTAKADNDAKFAIQPANSQTATTKTGYFVLKGQPGEVIKDTVAVVNTGSTPVTLVVYATDAQTGQQTGVTYNKLNEPGQDVGAWINIQQKEVEIAPQSRVNVPFTLTVPKEARPGQHVGGIAVQQKDAAASTTKPSGNFAVTVNTLAVSPVKINVGDAEAAPSLKITNAQMGEIAGKQVLTLGLKNDGNSLITPKGTATLTDASGKTVMDTKLALDTILPQDGIAYPVSGTLPEPGTYKVHASLDFGGSAPAVYDGQVEVKAQPAKAAATAPAATVAANQPAAANSNASSGNNAQPASTAAAIPASSDNGMMMGIVIGVAVMLALTTLGLGGYIVATRGKKGN